MEAPLRCIFACLLCKRNTFVVVFHFPSFRSLVLFVCMSRHSLHSYYSSLSFKFLTISFFLPLLYPLVPIPFQWSWYCLQQVIPFYSRNYKFFIWCFNRFSPKLLLFICSFEMNVLKAKFSLMRCMPFEKNLYTPGEWEARGNRDLHRFRT